MVTDGSWAVLVTAFIMVVYIAQGGIMLSAVVHLSHVVGAKWRADIAPYAHRTVALYPLALVLLVVLLIMKARTFPYYEAVQDGHLALNGWHHYGFLVAREVGLLIGVAALHYSFAWVNERIHRGQGKGMVRCLTACSAAVPFVYFIYGTVVAWDFEMTLVPGWHSSMYAPYFFVSNFHMFLGFFVLWMYLRRLRGRYGKLISDQSFNYLAQMMLGLTLLWIYTFFAQFLTIWYGNLPDETGRFYAMIFAGGDMRQGPATLAPLFWWFVALKAFVPFVLLIFALVRHTPGLIAFVGGVILFGTFLERYTWIASAYGTDHIPLTSVFDIGLALAVGILVFASIRAMPTLRVTLVQRRISVKPEYESNVMPRYATQLLSKTGFVRFRGHPHLSVESANEGTRHVN